MGERSALQWLIDNADGMAIAMVAAFAGATLSTTMRRLGLRMLLLGLLAAFMFTGLTVPVIAIFFKLSWIWWGPIGGLIGLAWTAIAWFAIRFTNRLADRAPEFADAVPVILPGLPSVPQQHLPPRALPDANGGAQ